jgi:hypothetical protein
MVSFTQMGRMGNFLFECATAFAYAKKHDLPFSVPLRTHDDFHCPIYLHHLQNPGYNPGAPAVRIDEKQHNYQDLPFEEAWRNQNILLVGYWQTEKYFAEYRHEIIDAFKFAWTPKLGVVSIHVRRGDYVTFREKHPEVTDEFYFKSIYYFIGMGIQKFQIYSDDIPYCKTYFIPAKFPHAHFAFMEGNSIEEDLRLISCCAHHINSSSTYSWWGAWLNRNPNKVIITPELWFSEGWGGLDISDIIPDTWIKM